MSNENWAKLVNAIQQELFERQRVPRDAWEVFELVRVELLVELAKVDTSFFLIDDPIHESAAPAIEKLVDDLDNQLTVLRDLAMVLRAQQEDDMLSFYEQTAHEATEYFTWAFARPFSECLKNWTKGYADNRAKSWGRYLTNASVHYNKKWKNGRPAQPMSRVTLQRRFDKIYSDMAGSHGLFCDEQGNVIPRPTAGTRRNQVAPKAFEVERWECDRAYARHGGTNFQYSIPPTRPDLYGGHVLPSWATEFDRYFCPMWEDCGGVLVPVRRLKEKSSYSRMNKTVRSPRD
jgi:hypothetical protein